MKKNNLREQGTIRVILLGTREHGPPLSPEALKGAFELQWNSDIAKCHGKTCSFFRGNSLFISKLGAMVVMFKSSTFNPNVFVLMNTRYAEFV